MKVRFLTDIGREIGNGHFSRCLSLSQAFLEENISSVFYVFSDDDQFNTTTNIEGSELIYCEWHKHFRTLLLPEYKNDIVIIDSYLLNIDTQMYLEKHFCQLVSITDSRLKHLDKGLIIFGNDIAFRIIPEYLFSNIDVTLLLGFEYCFLRRIYWDIPETQIRPIIKDIIISLGASDLRNLLKQVIPFMAKRFPDVKFHVVGNSNEKNIDFSNVIEYGILNEYDYFSLLSNVDYAILNAGQSLMEAARIGLPASCIQIAKNQKYNAEYWEELGFAINLGPWDSINLFQSIEDSIIQSNYKNRKIRSQIGSDKIDGQGPRRIIKHILTQIK